MRINYDPHLALSLAEHAQQVYRAPHDLWSWAIDRGCDGASLIEKRSTQVGVTYSPEEINIVMRGSSQWGDWGENFLAFPWRWREVFPVGRIHFGFRTQARRVDVELRATVVKLHARYPNAQVNVTGHSLGGAGATILAPVIELAGVPVSSIYTFESPRVGTQEWADWYEEHYGDRTFRVVAVRRGRADIVTRIPPSCWGWRHVGRPIMIRDGECFGDKGDAEAEWEAARSAHPVKPLSQIRIISGAVVSVQAHLCGALVEELGALAQRAGAGSC